MKPGKISNTILKRTVIKSISKRKNSIKLNKLAVGADASVTAVRGENSHISECSDEVALCMATANGYSPLINAVNNIAVVGGLANQVHLSIVMPETAREIRLREIIEDINEQSVALGVEITGGNTISSDSVTKPVVSVTASGYKNIETRVGSNMAKPGDDIIVTKWIGISGIQRIIEAKKEEILDKYPTFVVDKAYGSWLDKSIVKEARIAIDNGVTALHDVSSGGIFAGLWDMAEASGVGIDVDFRQIPVCQEIIEICEMYDINPYELESMGCLLMTSSNGCGIVEMLSNCGITATVIGKVTDNNDKIIRNCEEERFLDLPKTDEIYKLRWRAV